MKSLKKMNLIENNVNSSLHKIGNLKNKISAIKKYLIINSARLYLNKNKLKNLQHMQIILKEYIIYWDGLFKNIKELKKDENIGLIYDILKHIIIGIKKFLDENKLINNFFINSSNDYAKEEKEMKSKSIKTNHNGNYGGNYKSLKIIDIIYNKCEKKINKITINFNKNFSNLFNQKKETYLCLFFYQLYVNLGDITNYTKVNFIFKSIKKNIGLIKVII